jgi:hypothetical protein
MGLLLLIKHLDILGSSGNMVYKNSKTSIEQLIPKQFGLGIKTPEETYPFVPLSLGG